MIKAVFFDAVGTLIHPDPSAIEVYAQVGKQFGSKLEKEEIGQRFRFLFQLEEFADFQNGLKDNEDRERERWRNIVAGVLNDVSDPTACFHVLYDHFSQPEAWRCDPEAALVLEGLLARGYQVGLASNYDHRLRTVMAGLKPLQLIQHVVISSEVGWRKPAKEFFSALGSVVKLPAEEILLVGDDLINDYEGAKKAGLKAVLLDNSDTNPLTRDRISRLNELLENRGFYHGEADQSGSSPI
jgi:putative hydrolase of the HAD superfamily